MEWELLVRRGEMQVEKGTGCKDFGHRVSLPYYITYKEYNLTFLYVATTLSNLSFLIIFILIKLNHNKAYLSLLCSAEEYQWSEVFQNQILKSLFGPYFLHVQLRRGLLTSFSIVTIYKSFSVHSA